MTTTYETIHINPSSIVPPHQVNDWAKHDAIREALTENGWTGRPLLVIEAQDTFIGVTGSHRTEAAKDAEMDEVPCVVIDCEALNAEGYDSNYISSVDDDTKYFLLRDVFGADADCTRLMAEEIASNEAA